MGRAAGQRLSAGAFESAPGSVAALAAGVDDAGEQGHDPRADRGTGAQAELAQDHPVLQGAISGVVGQRWRGMTQKLSGKKLRCYAGFQFPIGPRLREIGLF